MIFIAFLCLLLGAASLALAVQLYLSSPFAGTVDVALPSRTLEGIPADTYLFATAIAAGVGALLVVLAFVAATARVRRARRGRRERRVEKKETLDAQSKLLELRIAQMQAHLEQLEQQRTDVLAGRAVDYAGDVRRALARRT